MARARPCERCRKRKVRCIQYANGTCQFCLTHKLECVTTRPKAPVKVEIQPLQPPPLDHNAKTADYIPTGYLSAAVLGPSCDEDPFLLQYYKSDTLPILHNKNTPVVLCPFNGSVDSDVISTFLHKRERVSNLVTPFEERLLALYFKYIDWSYPAVDKTRFNQLYFHDAQKLNQGLLYGMLALSTIYWKYDASLCVERMPSNLPQRLWDLCALYCTLDNAQPTLESVSAMLLLVQKRLPSNNLAERFENANRLGSLVASAYTLGLNLDCSEWKISEHEKLVRRRLWALVYYNDKWCAANLGRPSLLHGSRTSVPSFNSDIEQEQLFVHMFGVTQLLDGVLESLYQPARCYGNLDERAFERDALIRQQWKLLGAWCALLPESLASMTNAGQDEFCRNGTLHLSILTVKCLVLRAGLNPRSMGTPSFEYYRGLASQLVSEIIGFTSLITHNHLHAFWHAPCCLNFSTLAHFVFMYFLQSTKHEQDEIREPVRKWLWALRVLSNAWKEGTGLASLHMDSVFHMAQSQICIPHPPETAKEPGLDLEFEGILNPDIIPKHAQESEYSHHEFVPGAASISLEGHIAMDDLLKDDLWELLNEGIRVDQGGEHV